MVKWLRAAQLFSLVACSPMRDGINALPMMARKTEGAYDMDIEPDDIEVSDTVTVVWEII